jgi:chromatin remodeling complex protein RSC6
MERNKEYRKMPDDVFSVLPSNTHATAENLKTHETDVVDHIQDNVLDELMHVYDELSSERKRITHLMANVKKCCNRMSKRLSDQQEKIDKLQHQHKSRNSGLTKPFPISTSLCSFMSVPEGTQIARAEVTKYLHKYIKEKDLYDTNKKMYFKPDSSLKKLLNIHDADEPVHIFAIQKKMNDHFHYTQ